MSGFWTKTSVEALFALSGQRHSLELCAGAGGLRNAVSWVYLAEDVRNASFLRGGEFVITTGLFTHEGVSLQQFVEAILDRGSSALLVNLGPYLSRAQLTPQVRGLCDRASLPLLVMPWEVHLVDIMQEFSAALLQNRQREGSLDAAFEAALYQSPVSYDVLHGLDRFGFPADGTYRVVVIHNLTHPDQTRSELNRRGLRYHLFRHDNLHVLVHSLATPEAREDELCGLLCRDESVTIGMSSVIGNLADFGEAFRRALFSLSVAELWQRPFVSFEELGMLQLLFCVSDQRLLEDLLETYLGPLVAYDEEHDSDLVHTLQVYLLADCTVQATAARLPAHRNTVVYRMRRVKEVLGVDLDQAMTKFNLLLAFYIREYLSM